jgi:xylulokinase
MVFLGVDIGTSSMKTIVVDADGIVLARGTADYPSSRPAPLMVEQHPEDWTRALRHCIDELSPALRLRITAIGVVGHVPTLVAVDENGTAVRPALIWQDNRAEVQAKVLAGALGDAEPLIGTALPWAPSQLPAKLRWLAEHEPATVATTRWVLQPKDVLNLWLTGVAATDRWSSKGLCRVDSGRAASPIIAACGWTDAVIPPAVDPWSILGTIEPARARLLGLPADVVVAGGWTDAMGAFLAVGGFDAPTGVVLTGTSEIVGVSAENAVARDGIYLVPRPVAPLVLAYGPTQSSGASLAWISRETGLPVGTALDAAAAASGTAPTFVPYLDGERAPLWSPAVRGLFLGLDSAHTKGHLVRAVVEGVALSARHVLDEAERMSGERVSHVNVGGRGIDHPAWLAARSGALDRELHLHQEDNLSALGAAMTAAMALGIPRTELHRLRQAPTVVSVDDGMRSDWNRRYEDYLEASSIAMKWSTR